MNEEILAVILSDLAYLRQAREQASDGEVLPDVTALALIQGFSTTH